MKTSIRRKILIVVMVPAFLLLAGASIYTVERYYTNQTTVAEAELEDISRITADDIEGKITGIRNAVQSAALIIEQISYEQESARQLCDAVVRSMLVDQNIFNAWIIFEPNAFDGKDELYTDDYPGAPSGRLMRSYIKKGEEIVMVPDMDENEVDDPKLCYWYTTPRDEDRLYVDTESSQSGLYTFPTGDNKTEVYTLSIVTPIHREGKVIGCIGADITSNEFMRSLKNVPSEEQMDMAIFYADGMMFYAMDSDEQRASISSLEFTSQNRIRQAMAYGVPLFLHSERSKLSKGESFVSFQPIYTHTIEVEGMTNLQQKLYLYAALPEDVVFSDLARTLRMTFVFAGVLIFVLAALMHFLDRIAKKIGEISQAADAISQGQLGADIPLLAKSDGELHILTKSLQRMVEQFHIYIMMEQQSKLRLSTYSSLIEATQAEEDIREICRRIVETLHEQISCHKITFVLLSGSRAVDIDTGEEFIHHNQIKTILADKGLVFLNQTGIVLHKLDCMHPYTVSACFLPFRQDGQLRGYILFENDDQNQGFTQNNEAVFAYVVDILENMFSMIKEEDMAEDIKQESEMADAEDVREEHKEKTFFDKIRDMPQIDVEAALSAVGGIEAILEKTIRLTVRLVPDRVEVMREQLKTEDIAGFAIEVHGMKGSLNNIGAVRLAKAAGQLEAAAKSGENQSCAERFPAFADEVLMLAEKLQCIIIDEQKQQEVQEGDIALLKVAAEKAEIASQEYDCFGALEILKTVTEMRFDAVLDETLRKAVERLEEFECEEAEALLHQLIEKLEQAEDGGEK